MAFRIITDLESIEDNMDTKLLLREMGEPDLYAICYDPAFIIQKVPHEYVCFDSRHGEIIKIEQTSLDRLKDIT